VKERRGNIGMWLCIYLCISVIEEEEDDIPRKKLILILIMIPTVSITVTVTQPLSSPFNPLTSQLQICIYISIYIQSKTRQLKTHLEASENNTKDEKNKSLPHHHRKYHITTNPPSPNFITLPYTKRKIPQIITINI